MNSIQARKNASLQRRRKKLREPYDVVLIVCEGAKTEPAYFTALKNELRLSSTNVHICGKECGPAPISVVDYAIDEFKKSGDYNRIYCVFDKDRHESYAAAVDKVRRTKLRGGAKIFAITSVPCFEYWLLLHFKESARPYGASARLSPCEELLQDLKTHIADYEKGNDVFRITYPMIDQAIMRARVRDSNCLAEGTDNPSTKIYQLVTYLQRLKQ